MPQPILLPFGNMIIILRQTQNNHCIQDKAFYYKPNKKDLQNFFIKKEIRSIIEKMTKEVLV